MEHIKVILQDMPHAIRGLTVYAFDDGEAFYTMFINARLNTEMQKRAYNHEIEHIDRKDFSKMWSVQEIEGMRHES